MASEPGRSHAAEAATNGSLNSGATQDPSSGSLLARAAEFLARRPRPLARSAGRGGDRGCLHGGDRLRPAYAARARPPGLGHGAVRGGRRGARRPGRRPRQRPRRRRRLRDHGRELRCPRRLACDHRLHRPLVGRRPGFGHPRRCAAQPEQTGPACPPLQSRPPRSQPRLPRDHRSRRHHHRCERGHRARHGRPAREPHRHRLQRVLHDSRGGPGRLRAGL